MVMKYVKVHYKRSWQTFANVDAWRYRWNYLVDDIMRSFFGGSTKVPKFKVTCLLNGEYVNVFDNASLCRCLLLGENEINLYVDVDEFRVEVDSCNMSIGNEVGPQSANVNYVEEMEEEEGNTVKEKLIADGIGEQPSNAFDEFGSEDIDCDGVSFSQVGCGFSTDSDGDYKNVDEHFSDSNTSLEDEDMDHICSDDGLSNIASDEDTVEQVFNDSEMDEEIKKMRKAEAGTWFKKRDDGSIHLQVGMKFDNVYHFRSVLRDYMIQEGFEIIRHKNEKSRVTVSCMGDGCTWRLHASPMADGVTYKIKTYTGDHTCVRKTKFSVVTSSWIASNLFHKFAAEPNKSRRGIEQDLLDGYGISGMSNIKLFRARQKAKKMLHGDEKEQYGKLRAYGEMVLKYNPGSLFKVQPWERQSFDRLPMFKRMFVMFEGVKSGFLEGCRPFFGLDGCFLKGAYGGILLSAVALDGNNGVLPLAVSVVESECRDSWMFFLRLLKEAIGVDFDGIPWTIISDRQKGLMDAITTVFPNANQRFCLFHIEANFSLKFRGGDLKKGLRAAGSACDFRSYTAAMESIKIRNPEAHEWLVKIPSNLWSRHAFTTDSKVDHMTNQACESFNNWINNHRDQPILTLLEGYRLKVMKRLHSRYQRASKWTGKLVPNAVKRINAEWQQARKIDVVSAGHGEYQCQVNSEMRVINLTNWTCDCGRWNLTGIPCMHAMACIRTINEEVEDYCHAAFLTSKYFKVYKHMIHPQPDIGVLPCAKELDDCLQPPPYKRRPGRPKKARKIHASEKLQTQRSTVIHCSRCKEIGHNIRRCQNVPVTTEKLPRTSTSKTQDIASGTQESRQSEIVTRHQRPKLGIRSKRKRQT